MDTIFDIVILGGGPGGYHGALLAAERGLSVALIEKKRVGGVCLNEGCVPSKTLLNSAKYALDHSDFALEDSTNTIDFIALQKRKSKVVSTLVKSIETSLKKGGVTLFEGKGTFTHKTETAFTLEVINNEGTQKVRAHHAIIATGSTPFIPPIEGVNLPHVVTSSDILDTTTPPKSLVVVGGGVIGLEMASVFAAAGTSVTVVELQNSIGGNLDKDIEKMLKSSLKKQGITILTDTKVTKISETHVFVETKKGEQLLEAQQVLLSVGRTPAVSSIGLENIGLEVDRAIATNNQCQTSLSNLYAIGDVNGKSLLAHTAYREAEVAIATISRNISSVDYTTIPSVIYTKPEIAAVGLSEEDAQKQNISVVTATLPFGSNGRFLAETSKERGVCKVVLDATTKAVLGVQLCGLYSGEIISTAATFVQLGITQKQIETLVLPHPTVAEILKETILLA